MGPNLTRLFEESKKQKFEKRDGYTVITNAIAANIQLELLLKSHGEALIETLGQLLEENENYININNLSAMGNVNLVNARTLLAQLEAEAHP